MKSFHGWIMLAICLAGWGSVDLVYGMLGRKTSGIGFLAGIIAILLLFGPICKLFRVVPVFSGRCPHCRKSSDRFFASFTDTCRLDGQKEGLLLLKCPACETIIGYRHSDGSLLVIRSVDGASWAVRRLKMGYPKHFGYWYEDRRFAPVRVTFFTAKTPTAV